MAQPDNRLEGDPEHTAVGVDGVDCQLQPAAVSQELQHRNSKAGGNGWGYWEQIGTPFHHATHITHTIGIQPYGYSDGRRRINQAPTMRKSDAKGKRELNTSRATVFGDRRQCLSERSLISPTLSSVPKVNHFFISITSTRSWAAWLPIQHLTTSPPSPPAPNLPAQISYESPTGRSFITRCHPWWPPRPNDPSRRAARTARRVLRSRGPRATRPRSARAQPRRVRRSWVWRRRASRLDELPKVAARHVQPVLLVQQLHRGEQLDRIASVGPCARPTLGGRRRRRRHGRHRRHLARQQDLPPVALDGVHAVGPQPGSARAAAQSPATARPAAEGLERTRASQQVVCRGQTAAASS